MSSSRSRRARLATAGGCLLAVLSPALAVADDAPAAEFDATGTQYAVATESPYAAAAAADVLDAGGSAIDAAIAAVLDLGVTYQDMCGLGGGGFLVHRTADGQVRTIDFREKASVNAYLDGKMHRSVPGSTFETGHDVIGVPGTLAGLALAHDLGGRLAWPTLFRAAIRDARDGYHVSPVTAGVLSKRAGDIDLFAETRKIYLEADGTPYDAGDRHVQPDLGDTLARLASGNTDQARREFYLSGRTYDALLAEFTSDSPYKDAGDDSPITSVDLRSYNAVVREPVISDYDGYQVIGMPPPSSGGVAIAEVLNILEDDDLDAVPRADRIHLLAEAQKIAFADRAKWMGDPAFTRIPVAGLTSEEYGEARRRDIRLELAQQYKAGSFDGYGDPAAPGATNEGPQTTHVSVIGADGEAVAVTCSQERGLGSAVVAKGTGILLNGQLHDFDEAAPRGAANEYAPGKRPRSSMSPTLVVDQAGNVVLSAGSQGGPKIIMAVLNALLGVVDVGLPAHSAIALPRVSIRRDGISDTLEVEHFPYDAEGAALFADLQRRGHSRIDAFEGTDPRPATVTAVSVGADGSLTAANDRRGYASPRSASIGGSRAR